MSEKKIEPNWNALEKEVEEINKKKKEWDKAFDRLWEIWGICAKNEQSFWAWRKTHPDKAI